MKIDMKHKDLISLIVKRLHLLRVIFYIIFLIKDDC